MKYANSLSYMSLEHNSTKDLVQTYCDQSPASRLALKSGNQLTTQVLPKISTQEMRKLEVEWKCSPVQVVDFKTK